MSRIGKMPVALPNGVQAEIKGNLVTLKGQRGSLVVTLGSGVQVVQEGSTLVVKPLGDDKQSKANYGTARALLNTSVKGLTQGWKRNLDLNGVGFGAKLAGQTLTLSVGFSHEVVVTLPKDIKCTVTKNSIELESANRELLGTYASKIRKIQPPEPYLGKGIKYSDEKVRRKAGKTAKK